MGIFLFIIGKIFDIILWPLKGFPPFFGLGFIAIITGFLAVLIFKYASDQKALKKIMTQIKLHFAEIILYKDDISQILHAQKEILKQNLRYFVRTIKPAIPIVAMVLLILSQLNIRYSIHTLSPGEPITVKVTKEDTTKHNPNPEDSQEVELILPDGIQIVTPAFHMMGSRQIEWRITGTQTGEFTIGFKVGEQTFQKRILIGPYHHPFSPHLGKQGFIEMFFNPLEPLLPNDSPIEAIDLGYEARTFNLGIFGLRVHWLVAFLVIAIAFGLVCRKLLKVS